MLFAGLAQKLLSSHLPASVDSLHVTPSHDSNKLQTELNERTAEISRIRDQMSQQQSELEQLRNKLKSQEGIKNSLDAASHELVCNNKNSHCYLVSMFSYFTFTHFTLTTRHIFNGTRGVHVSMASEFDEDHTRFFVDH